MEELLKIRHREIKMSSFQDNEKALKALVNCPEIFSPLDLIMLGEKHRGAAIYINFNDDLRNKIDYLSWLRVMSNYSLDSAMQYNAIINNANNQFNIKLGC